MIRCTTTYIAKILTGVVIGIVLTASTAHAQREYNTWYFGHNVGIVFEPDGPRGVRGPPPFINSTSTLFVYSHPKTGEPLFYTDGAIVYNRFHQIMPNGIGIRGSQLAQQPVILLADSGDANRVYVVTADAPRYIGMPDTTRHGITYSIVDLNADGGRGDVVVKNITMLSPATGRLTAFRLCDGSGFWIAAHEWGSDRFFAWRLSARGIEPPVISSIGITIGGSRWFDAQQSGQMAFSPDGQKLAIIINYDHLLQIFRFDNTTGVLSDAITIGNGPNWGLAFSPDARLLYTTNADSLFGSPLAQYAIHEHHADSIQSSMVVLDRYDDPDSAFPRQLHNGPDGRIYLAMADPISPGQRSLDVITNPNARGLAAGLVKRAVSLPGHPSPRNFFMANLTNVPSGGLELGTASAGRDTAICGGSTVQLRASGAIARAVWSPSNELSCADCLAPIAMPSRTTTYTATLSTAFGCSLVDSVTILVNDAPTIAIAPVPPLCKGDTARLDASGGIAYRWSGDSLSCIDCGSPSAYPTVTTIYTVQAFDANGCVGYDTITVRVVEASADAGPDASICLGDSVMLRGSSARSWRWTPAASLSCDTCRSPIAFPATTTLYNLAVVSDDGCTGSDVVAVTVYPAPAVEASGDTMMCAGGTAQLSARGGVAYEWSPPSGLSCIDCASPLALPATTTMYRVRVTDAGGCSNHDSVLIEIAPPLTIDVGDVAAICLGDSVQLRVDGGSDWRWSPSDGLSCVDCPSPIAYPTSSTTYTVSARNAFGCSSVDSVRIVVNAPPILIPQGDTTICPGSEARLSATGGATYRWMPSDGLSCSDCANPTARPATTTTYTVIAHDANGCADTANVTVLIAPAETVIASIARGVVLLPGEGATVSVDLERELTIDSIAFTINWNPGAVIIGNIRPSVQLKEQGWIVTDVSEGRGFANVTMKRAGVMRVGPGAIIDFDARVYFGDSLISELPFTLAMNALECATIEARSGQVGLDSICGLSIRQMEIAMTLLKLDPPAPTPMTGQSTITFSVPFESYVELRMIDAHGRVARTLVKGRVSQGNHAVEVETRDLSSGVYELQLRCSGITRAVRAVVVN